MRNLIPTLVCATLFRQHGPMRISLTISCKMAGAIGSILALGTLPVMAEEVADKSFTLLLNGDPIAIDPGETVTAKMPDGRSIELKLIRNPEVVFKGDGFSFRHSSDYRVSSSNPADDVSQHLIVTGSGTLVLVQAYQGMNPTTLNQFMLDQVTGDDVKAGARIASEPASRPIAGGNSLSGLKAVVTAGNDVADVEIMSGQTSKGGIVAVSRMDRDNEQTDRAFVDRFWSTLTLE